MHTDQRSCGSGHGVEGSGGVLSLLYDVWSLCWEDSAGVSQNPLRAHSLVCLLLFWGDWKAGALWTRAPPRGLSMQRGSSQHSCLRVAHLLTGSSGFPEHIVQGTIQKRCYPPWLGPGAISHKPAYIQGSGTQNPCLSRGDCKGLPVAEHLG